LYPVALSAMGLELAIDDFGSGIPRAPTSNACPSKIKIDRPSS
jgi:EAL domain-containing protein (putative c-di-GMP-specific phosphodiesterase class I)